MKVTTAAKALRKHLLKYWDNAENWASGSGKTWPHERCLITLPMRNYGFVVDALPQTLPEENDLLELLNVDGKEGVLAYLDMLILAEVQ